MTEEIIRQRYIALKGKLASIQIEMNKLEKSTEKLKSLLDDCIVIDDNVDWNSTINTIEKNKNNIVEEINGNIIPIVNQRISQ